MPKPSVYDSNGSCVGSWDRWSGSLESENGSSMNVDSDGRVTDVDGNYVGRIDSRGHLE